MSQRQYPCDCGCGQSAHFSEMTVSRYRVRDSRSPNTRPLGKSWMVRKVCREQFEKELGWRVRYEILVKVTVAAGFAGRLCLAPECYRLQVGIHQRLKGRPEARRIARGCVWQLLLPRWWIARPIATNPIPQ